MLRSRCHFRLLAACLLVIGLTSCGGKSSAPASAPQSLQVSGGRSGMFVVDTLVQNSANAQKTRRAALMGVFVSHYLSTSPTATVNSGIDGIAVQTAIFKKQSTVSDPDFDLIQAFADALQVDVLDLLNRSLDRQATLDIYITSLDAVASRANTRLSELTEAEKTQSEMLRQLSRERSDLERDLRNATSDRDYLLANEKQKLLNEKEREFSETQLQLDQTSSVIQTLEDLLELYGDKSLAIQENREPLIAGTKVIDLPGTLDLRILERRGNRSGGGTVGGSRQSGTSGGSTTTGTSQNGAQTTGGSTAGTNQNNTAANGATNGTASSGSVSGGSGTSGSTRGGAAGSSNSTNRPGGSGTSSSSSSRRTTIFGNPFGSFGTDSTSSANSTANTNGARTTNQNGATGGTTAGGGTTGGRTTGGTGLNGGGGAAAGTGDRVGGSGAAIDVEAILSGGEGAVHELVALIIALLLIFSLFLCLLFLVWGGIKFITSAGNEESIKKAGASIRYALAGLVVCLFGYFIVYWMALLLEAPFDLSFSHIIDLMGELYKHFNKPLS